MEASLLKLNDLLSKKETETFSITGTTEDGTFRCLVEPEANFKEGITHYVYLKSFTGWSYFPNLDSTNNKFYYSKGPLEKPQMKTIRFQTGSYQLTDYNNFIHSQMIEKGEEKITDRTTDRTSETRSEAEIKADKTDEHAISIFPYIPTSRIMIRVKKGYKVYFLKGSWFKELGFNQSQILEEGLHMAPNRADLMKTLKVRIECNLCKGFRINQGNKIVYSNVLYEFPNNKSTGEPISINPNPVIYTTLIQKRFNEIVLKFYDDDGKVVNFQGEEFNCVICIGQV